MLGFVRVLREQLDNPGSYEHLCFEDRIGLLVDREWTEREGCGLTRRLQLARLRDRTACVEGIDYRHARGLDRALVKRLATCEWIKKAPEGRDHGLDRLRQDVPRALSGRRPAATASPSSTAACHGSPTS